MIQTNDILTFEDLCSKYSLWILKYCSTNFAKPLYIIWYYDTDENETARLLTLKSGNIFAGTSLSNFKATLLSAKNNLVVSEKLYLWLDNFKDLEVTENCTYDLISMEKEISKNNLDIATIEGFANFINLFTDFVEQDEQNNQLQVYADDELINEAWLYYYAYIFWPRFNDKEKFEKWDRPKLEIDTKELIVRLNTLMKKFEDGIEPIG